MTFDQVKIALLTDRVFLAKSMCENNPVAIAAKLYAQGFPVGTKEQDLATILSLYDKGYTNVADKIIDVPWLSGHGDAMVEQVLNAMAAESAAASGNRGVVGQALLGGIVGFISGFSSTMNQANTPQPPPPPPPSPGPNWGKIALWAGFVILVIIIIILVVRSMKKNG